MKIRASRFLFATMMLVVCIIWTPITNAQIPTYPPGSTCGYHSLPCCPPVSAGYPCADGSTCMPNQYCVFPVSYTPPVSSPTQQTQPTATPTTSYSYPTPTLTAAPLPTNSQNACGQLSQSCCDPIKLITDPNQSQAVTSASGYCYLPYRCSSGACVAQEIAATSTPTSTPNLTTTIPSWLKPLLQRLGLQTATFVTTFTLTLDLQLPSCDAVSSSSHNVTSCIQL